ncbi:MAG TPA: GntR family transcriptional regulator [Firmicutes bacterium]|nr:GntR family transcriptional regulator [Bacillota bacterium]
MKRVIVDLIRKGEWPNGHLPPEGDLARELGISRTTVREALAAMAREGIVVKKQGLGNLIVKSALQASFRFDLIVDFADMIADAGYQPELRQSRPRRVKGVAVGPDNAVRGNFLTYDECFLADGRPAILLVIYIPEELVLPEHPPLEKPIRQMGELLSLLTGRTVNHSLAYFRPDVAAGDTVRAFSLKEGEPIIAWNEVFYDLSDVPICYTDIRFHPKIIKLSMLRMGSYTYTSDCPSQFVEGDRATWETGSA